MAKKENLLEKIAIRKLKTRALQNITKIPEILADAKDFNDFKKQMGDIFQ